MKEYIRKAIESKEIMIFVIPESNYWNSLSEIAKALSEAHPKTCHISLNKPISTVVQEFEKNGLDIKKFFFIDCVGKEPDTADVIHVSSPKALTELSISIKKTLGKGGIKSALFDSLSTLLIYEDSSTVIKFAHSIISAFRSKGTKAILTSLKGDTKSELIKDLSMFADVIVEME
jgi:hypothetical protein